MRLCVVAGEERGVRHALRGQRWGLLRGLAPVEEDIDPGAVVGVAVIVVVVCSVGCWRWRWRWRWWGQLLM